ncbi:MAG: zinc-binding dehydrogenase [candidate division NC10 bacterium]|nr:zinc-binding dehydrogenase [candidate division NC10 bacterium]
MQRAGTLDRLERHTDSLPDPGPGEARVIPEAIGLNFADIFACLGLYSATPAGAFVPGLEFAGVVEALGPAVPPPDPSGEPTHPIRPGDRVFGLTRFGAYATAVNLGVRYLRPIPPGWSFAEGAAFPVQALTAWHGLTELGALEPGDSVLVHSAAGGVGLNALAILAAVGARVVATVGRPAKRDFLVERCGLSPNQVIVRDRHTFGPQLDRALAALRLDLIWLWDHADRLARAYDRLAHLVQRPPFVGRRFGFDDAPAALRYLQSGESIGKVVLEV